MKKYLAVFMIFTILISVIAMSTAYAKYTSSETLTFDVTVNSSESTDDPDAVSGETLVPGEKFNEMVKSIAHLYVKGIYFGSFEKKCKTMYEIDSTSEKAEEYWVKGTPCAINEDGEITDDIRMFCVQWDYVYVLVRNDDDMILFNNSCKKMFSFFPNLTVLDFGKNVNTSQVTDMSYMFYNDSSKGEYGALANLDLSCFDTSNVTNMSYMFSVNQNCLKSLDLSSFNTSKVTDMSGMFYNCTNLATIYVANGMWDTSKCTESSDMFIRCWYLVGGNGTRFNQNQDKTDKTYARIDTPGSPGYLTDILQAADLDDEIDDTTEPTDKAQTTSPKQDESEASSPSTEDTEEETDDTVIDSSETDESEPDDSAVTESTPEDEIADDTSQDPE